MPTSREKVIFLEKAAEKFEEASEIAETLSILENKEIMKMLERAEKAGDEEFVEL